MYTVRAHDIWKMQEATYMSVAVFGFLPGIKNNTISTRIHFKKPDYLPATDFEQRSDHRWIVHWFIFHYTSVYASRWNYSRAFFQPICLSVIFPCALLTTTFDVNPLQMPLKHGFDQTWAITTQHVLHSAGNIPTCSPCDKRGIRLQAQPGCFTELRTKAFALLTWLDAGFEKSKISTLITAISWARYSRFLTFYAFISFIIKMGWISS